MHDAPRADPWTLLAKIAANPSAFAASGAVAAAAATGIMRNQLLHGTHSLTQLGELGRALGADRLTAAIQLLAGFEVQHVLTNIGGRGQSDGALETHAARRLLLRLAQGDEAPPAPPPPKPPTRTLHRHHFSGARRTRDGNLQPSA